MKFHRVSRLAGTVTVPGDKSISHRAVMFGSLARGKTEIRGFLPGADCLSTIGCFRAMGIPITQSGNRVTVEGRGLRGLSPAGSTSGILHLDTGNSGTTTRLIAGILAAQDFRTVLSGDDSLNKRPMNRIIRPLRLMGDSMNTKDSKELEAARDMLIAQKPLVQAYGVDDIRDKLASGEAALGVIYSGEAINLLKANPDLAFCPAPKEGTNLWMDGWVIPKQAKHVENAHKFIDFLCRPDIAAKNFEALGYSTPNTAVQALVEDDMDEDEIEIAFPDPTVYRGQETYQYLGEAIDKLYTKLWLQVKVE